MIGDRTPDGILEGDLLDCLRGGRAGLKTGPYNPEEYKAADDAPL
jgi:hypothetical protein